MARTDIHRPAEINPADYQFVAFEYLRSDDLGAAMFLQYQRELIRAHKAATGGHYASHQHGGNCHICGASAIYTALFYHPKSNAYVRTGLECAEKLECHGVEAFRREVKAATEARAGKRKAKAVLENAGLAAVWAVYEADIKARADHKVATEAWAAANPGWTWDTIEGSDCPKLAAKSWAENTMLDIVGKLIKWGSISEKQMAFLGKLVDQIKREPEIAAARAAEAAAAKPVPVSDKRVLVSGKVLTIRQPSDSAWGYATPAKMLVQHADGWKLWGTVPSNLFCDLKRGDEVEFSAKVTVSDNDPKFGFFSRPTKARLIEAAPLQAAA